MKKLLILSFLCFTVTFFSAQIKTTAPKPQVQSKTTTQPKTNTSVNSASKLTLKVKTNVDCNLYVDGELKFLIKVDEMKKISLPKGEFDIVAKPLNSDVYNKYHDVKEVTTDDIGSETIYGIDIKETVKGPTKQETVNWIINKFNNSFIKGVFFEHHDFVSSLNTDYGFEYRYDKPEITFDENLNTFIINDSRRSITYRNKSSRVDTYISKINLQSKFEPFILGDKKEDYLYAGIKQGFNGNTYYVDGKLESNLDNLNKAFFHLQELLGFKTYDKNNNDFVN